MNNEMTFRFPNAEVSPAEWIRAGGEVLLDDVNEAMPAAQETQDVMNEHGLEDMIEFLRDAADAASDHVGDGNGGSDNGPADAETVAKIDRFRAAMREALAALS